MPDGARRPPPWFDALSLRGVATLAHTPVDQLLAHGLRYDGAPTMDDDGSVRVAFRDARGVVSRVSLRPSRGGGPQVEHNCTCSHWGVCPHAAAAMADLAVCDELRDALLHEGDVAAALDALPSWRERVLRAWTAERIASAWLPLELRETVPPLEYALSLPGAETAGRSLQSRVAGMDGTARIELKVRVPGQKGFADGERLRALAPCADDQGLLRVVTARAMPKKTFQVSGAEGALLLHLLRTTARDRVVLAEGDALVFDDTALAPHLVRARLLRAQLALSLSSGDSGTIPTVQGATRGVWNPHLPTPADDIETDALEARWRSPDGAVDVPARETVMFRGAWAFLWVPALRRVYAVDGRVDLDAAWRLQVSPAVELIPEHAETLWKTLRKRLRGRSVGLPSAAALGVGGRVPSFAVHVEGIALTVRARLDAHYPDGIVLVTPDALATADNDARRDRDYEALALDALRDAALTWDASLQRFAANDASAARFWTEGVPALQARTEPEITVLVPDAMGRPTVRGAVKARLRLSVSGSILDLALALDAGGRKVHLDAARAALANKRRWIELDDRSLAEITDAVAELLDDTDTLWEEAANDVHVARLPVHQLGRVERWMLEADAERDAEAERLHERLRALTVAAAPELPTTLAATLRPYQEQGLAWLQFLDALGAGGVLADDMGLGKTLMTLCLLAWQRERAGRAPSLVVCPTSVAGNWVAEAARFTPTLRVLAHYAMGPEARAAAPLTAVDVVVTTYALLRRDVEALRAVTFRCVVLDEAQGIKNADAATTRAARALRASLRLCLTGTPIENRLTELWSLLDFCNPGMLGARRSFEARFERPIAQAAVAGPASPKTFTAAVTGARLRALVRPFVLRRTRAEVLPELPPRQEVELACPLGDAQRQRYDALAVVLREEVREFVRRDPFGRAGVAMFTALLRLRQMACDPRLLDPASTVEGSKRAVFMATVRELAAEGRRALVFSQFTELLGLWASDLERDGIAYEYLDGATTDRDGVIRRFQEGTAPLFLLSLKAGGAGLNLTAADTVIHCDPWWNPAVEDQATARAHRLGQTRGVTVYRLVARGTVEERVLALKSRKRALADAVLGGDVSGALEGITADDILALLADADVAVDAEPDA